MPPRAFVASRGREPELPAAAHNDAPEVVKVKAMIPDAVDTHVGAKLRAVRIERGMSQSALGAAGGVTFQQIQKYDRGANRVSVSMLYKLAKALDTPVADFFPP